MKAKAMARPVLDQINIVSANMAEAIAFYRLLGVEFPEVATTKSGEPFHVSGKSGGETGLDLDSAEFAKVWNPAWKDDAKLGGRVVVGFSVETREEVDRLHATLTRAGYQSLNAPHDAFWGARYAIVEDPNGLAVGLMSPQNGEHRWPPEGWSG